MNLQDSYIYPAVFTKEDDGGYSVVFPDLEGCYTCGDDFPDAMKMAQDVLPFTLVYYENNKKQIAIKKLHGFGIYTYRVPLMIKAIASGVLIAITLSQKFHVIFALFAVLIDIIVFTHCIHTLESGEVVLYLKGEI